MANGTFNIVLSSPGDLGTERKSVEDVLKSLQRVFGDKHNIRLKLHRVEDARPGMGRPQSKVSKHLNIEDSDLFVCIFWKRFGTPTGEEASGTVEEFKTALYSYKAKGRPEIMLYFKEKAFFPKSIEECEQISKVWKFRNDVSADLFYVPFKTKDNFYRIFYDNLLEYLDEYYEKAKALKTAKKVNDLSETKPRLDNIIGDNYIHHSIENIIVPLDKIRELPFRWQTGRQSSGISTAENRIVFNEVDMAIYYKPIIPNFLIEYNVKLNQIINKSKFHDVRFHIFPDSTFREHITVIFPWEYVGDDSMRMQCRISYQITDRDLRIERGWDTPEIQEERNHAKEIISPYVYSGEKSELKKYDIRLRFNSDQLSIYSSVFETENNKIIIPIADIISKGYIWKESIYIGIQSVNSMVMFENVKLSIIKQ